MYSPGTPAQRAEDLATAQQLLEAAGLGDGFEAPLDVLVFFEIEQLAQLIQSSAAQLNGVNLQVGVLRLRDLLQRLLAGGQLIDGHRQLWPPGRTACLSRSAFVEPGADRCGFMECLALVERRLRRAIRPVHCGWRSRKPAFDRRGDADAVERRGPLHRALFRRPHLDRPEHVLGSGGHRHGALQRRQHELLWLTTNRP